MCVSLSSAPLLTKYCLFFACTLQSPVKIGLHWVSAIGVLAQLSSIQVRPAAHTEAKEAFLMDIWTPCFISF